MSQHVRSAVPRDNADPGADIEPPPKKKEKKKNMKKNTFRESEELSDRALGSGASSSPARFFFEKKYRGAPAGRPRSARRAASVEAFFLGRHRTRDPPRGPSAFAPSAWLRRRKKERDRKGPAARARGRRRPARRRPA